MISPRIPMLNMGGRLTVGTSTRASVGVVSESMDVDTTLSVGVVTGDVP